MLFVIGALPIGIGVSRAKKVGGDRRHSGTANFLFFGQSGVFSMFRGMMSVKAPMGWCLCFKPNNITNKVRTPQHPRSRQGMHQHNNFPSHQPYPSSYLYSFIRRISLSVPVSSSSSPLTDNVFCSYMFIILFSCFLSRIYYLYYQCAPYCLPD